MGPPIAWERGPAGGESVEPRTPAGPKGCPL